MGDSPAWAMLFTALVSVGFIGYVIFRIARGIYRWAMGQAPMDGRQTGGDWTDDDWDDLKIPENPLQNSPSYMDVPGNIYSSPTTIDQ